MVSSDDDDDGVNKIDNSIPKDVNSTLSDLQRCK